ncbi:ATP-binding cassette domain-containing protein [Fulvivirga sp. RKSG066]|nr:ATP-binding cassette domain-containing protein [Fulvivirga aurantia]MTI21726.1 ATP-binding cassette domain-containing protein [Fulvivirga aurantia]
MFKTQSLFFAYNESIYFRFPDIELTAGEDLLILGESGIGKTTLLHLMAGLLRPKSGSIALKGTSFESLSLRKLDTFRGRHIGLVFQRPQFFNALSLSENLLLIQYLAGKKQDIKRVRQVTERLAIDHKLKEKPYNMSQGEQQRAAIALAVINNPALILADEPTSSLDDKNCMKVATLLKQQAADTDATLIIITHDQRLKNLFQNTLEL